MYQTSFLILLLADAHGNVLCGLIVHFTNAISLPAFYVILFLSDPLCETEKYFVLLPSQVRGKKYQVRFSPGTMCIKGTINQEFVLHHETEPVFCPSPC